jgi:hypothetical protein
MELDNLPREIAEQIKKLRTGDHVYTWSQIAEILCKENKEFAFYYQDVLMKDFGVNDVGRDLCDKAAKSLGENPLDWELSLEKRLSRR